MGFDLISLPNGNPYLGSRLSLQESGARRVEGGCRLGGRCFRVGRSLDLERMFAVVVSDEEAGQSDRACFLVLASVFLVLASVYE